ncbi:hypothetical protein BDY21DRAFT_376742 [Lineolata rhizophorae]|uniref:BRCT domain-containing protein n=1 Tax=Lineolata rhizophorae TaxID=578093 RepID=A0A6A6PAB9_9PEZI|nr:hypothetical protein BDY21DRAFT_376742 [Lineolata rhizophorae]
MAPDINGPPDGAVNSSITKPESPLAEIAFTVVPSKDLTEKQLQSIIETLNESGAQYVPLTDEGRVHVPKCDYIISTTSDFPDYEAALDQFKRVVKPSWVNACIKSQKIVANFRPFSPDPHLFMSEVVVSCADIPEGDKEAIRGAVLAMGGQYTSALLKTVTHVIALSMDDVKCQMVLSKKLRATIVLPHWFDDCLRLRRKITEGPYTLPDPEILSGKSGRVAGLWQNANVQGAISATPEEMSKFEKGNLSPQWEPLSVFKGKSLKLGEDLGLSPRLREIIEQLIINGGGKTTEDIEKADTYICHLRQGYDYVYASQQCKDVGNLSWLFYLMTHNCWTSPMRRLLHYPVPPLPIPGFENQIICISNYSGEARIYLENLIRASGARFTKTLEPHNTHLITAQEQGEKWEAAKEWALQVTNHIWLEESYATYKFQSTTEHEYTHFPPRTNLGEVVGHIQIHRSAMERFFRDLPPKLKQVVEDLPREVASESPAPSNSPEELSNTAKTSKSLEKSHDSSDHQEPQSDTTRGAGSRPSTALEEPRESKLASAFKTEKGRKEKPTPLVKRKMRLLSDVPETPSKIGVQSGKENETPPTGSRSAKDKATAKLHDMSADIALYQKEMKRVGGVTHGGRRKSDQNAQPEKLIKLKGDSRKRSIEASTEGKQESSDKEDTSKPKAKKKKAMGPTPKIPPIEHRITISGDDRWNGNPKRETSEKHKLRELGIHVTENPADVTILCAPKIVRTKKFVSALAVAPHVLSTSFIDACLKDGKVPSFSKHTLSDRENEKKYGFSLAKALQNAKKNKGHMLKGTQILCTQEVKAGFETYNAIITSNGGKCMLYRGRPGLSITKRSDKSDADGDTKVTDSDNPLAVDPLYLISGTKNTEVALWGKFRDLAKKFDMTPFIVAPDWILTVAMAQEMKWDQQKKFEMSEQTLEKAKAKGW